jgi:4-aminobutyrate aminotransferase-like enzyme
MRVGEHLRGRLRALAGDTDHVGEVRGVGLLAGIDMKGPAGQADRAFAEAVRDGLVARGVLAGLTGPTGTVLKVRPPLVWREEHADHFVDALSATLAARGITQER